VMHFLSKASNTPPDASPAVSRSTPFKRRR
jgi:hypothetical protein